MRAWQIAAEDGVAIELIGAYIEGWFRFVGREGEFVQFLEGVFKN